MATMNVKDAAGSTVAVEKPLTPGQAAMAASRPVVIASDQSTVPVSLASVPSHAVTNAGTFVSQENGAALTALQLIDDPVATLGTTTYTEATTKGMIAGAVRRDANTSLVDTTNEIAPLQVNATGELKVAQIQALPAGTNNIGDVDVLTINGVAPAFGDGAKGATVLRTTLATDSPGVIATAAPGTLSAAGPSVTAVNPSQYETVAASQTAQVLGATGGTGDFINGLLVIPATTSPGNVLLLDNATSITVFAGGASSVSNLVPFFIPLGMTSVSGAWKVTTGSNVSAIGIGKFA